MIYDFVGNTERFNDPGVEYHRPKVIGTRLSAQQAGGIPPEPIPQPQSEEKKTHEFVLIEEGLLEDEFRRRETIIVGPDGLAMDRKTYQEKWAEKIVELHRTDPAVQKIFGGNEIGRASCRERV